MRAGFDRGRLAFVLDRLRYGLERAYWASVVRLRGEQFAWGCQEYRSLFISELIETNARLMSKVSGKTIYEQWRDRMDDFVWFGKWRARPWDPEIPEYVREYGRQFDEAHFEEEMHEFRRRIASGAGSKFEVDGGDA